MTCYDTEIQRAKFVVAGVYRTPEDVHEGFFSKFCSLLETLNTVSGTLPICGISISIWRTKNREAARFISLLDSCGLVQHVEEPTHVKNHTLDLVITRWNEIDNANMQNDHASVPCRQRTQISFRKWKQNDLQKKFKSDLSDSLDPIVHDCLDLEGFCTLFDSSIHAAVQKNACCYPWAWSLVQRGHP